MKIIPNYDGTTNREITFKDNYISLDHIPVITTTLSPLDVEFKSEFSLGEIYTYEGLAYIFNGSVLQSIVPPVDFVSSTYSTNVLKLATLKIQSVAIVNGGSGYQVNDDLTITGSNGAELKVVTVSSTGVITEVSITNKGAYSTVPVIPVGVTGGATFNLTLTTQQNKIAVKYDSVAISGDIWTFGFNSLHMYDGTNFLNVPCDYIQSKTPRNAETNSKAEGNKQLLWFNPSTVKLYNLRLSQLETYIDSTTSVAIILKSNFDLSRSGGGILKIDNEEILYTGYVNNTLTGVIRGINNTTQTEHAIKSKVIIITQQSIKTYSLSTALTAPVMELNNTTDLDTSGIVQIGAEKISYTGKTVLTLTGITRGIGFTTSTNHSAGVNVIQSSITKILATTLTAAVIELNDTADLSTSGIVQIGTEQISYTGKAAGNTLTGISRGPNPTDHNSGDAVVLINPQEFYRYRGPINLDEIIRKAADTYYIFKYAFYDVKYTKNVLKTTLYGPSINLGRYNFITFFGHTESAAADIYIGFSDTKDGTYYIDPVLKVTSTSVIENGIFHFRLKADNISAKFVRCIVQSAADCTRLNVNFTMSKN